MQSSVEAKLCKFILMMPKTQVMNQELKKVSRIKELFNQETRFKSKIQDSREEIKKQQVKTSHRISIERIFSKTQIAQFCFTTEFSQNFLS